MKLNLKPLALSLVLVSSAANAHTLTIDLDKSGSNPLLSDPHFAASAAAFVYEHVSALQDGDTVRLRSFGARDAATNMLDQQFEIGRRLKAKALARAIQSHILDLPNQPGQAQSSTNIIAALEFDSGLDCEAGGTVLLLTDGLEASQLVSGSALSAGTQRLPKLDRDLSGCHVVIYGLGAGLSPQSTKHLLKEWQGSITAAGGSFSAEIK